MKSYIKIARFDHWIKQIFVVPGACLAFMLTETDLTGTGRVLIAIIATSAAASANYCINEWLDKDFDKYHPVKKNRPSVTAGLNVKIVLVEYGLFVLISLILSSMLAKAVLFSQMSLLLMGLLYNVRPIRTKDIPYLDVLTESLNNAIRLCIGWFSVTAEWLPPSSVVVGYWMGGAFLMAAKRLAEYRMIKNAEQAGLYRKSFKSYTELKLLTSAMFYANMSVFSSGILLIKYKMELIIIVPFTIGLFCYYLLLCYREDSAAQKPEKLYKEKFLMWYCFGLVLLIIACCYVEIPALRIFLSEQLLPIKNY